jgi:hypothetical protein
MFHKFATFLTPATFSFFTACKDFAETLTICCSALGFVKVFFIKMVWVRGRLCGQCRDGEKNLCDKIGRERLVVVQTGRERLYCSCTDRAGETYSCTDRMGETFSTGSNLFEKISLLFKTLFSTFLQLRVWCALHLCLRVCHGRGDQVLADLIHISLPDFSSRLRGYGKCMEEGTIKTPCPKCRLYWCLVEFIDWRQSQSCWYF